MNQKSHFIIFIIIFITLFFASTGCDNKTKKNNKINDSLKVEEVYISVDETFMPVISEQIKVFESDNDKIKIIASYKSEADCFRDLQKDSTKMIIVARGLRKDEFEGYKNNLEFYPKNFLLAWDAITVIVNASSNDTLLSQQRLNELVTSTSKTQPLVVDGLNATSTVLYIQDSIAKGKNLGPNVQGVQGSKAVVDFVANNPQTIGFVGSSWVGNAYDPEQVAYFNKIKQVLVENPRDSLDRYVKPSQSTISTDLYPFIRPVWAILKENEGGPATRFLGFMRGERGQLIFKRANLVPAEMYFGMRVITIDNKPDTNNNIK